MRQLLKLFRTTLAGGVLFLIPFIVLIMFFERAVALAVKLVRPLAARLSHDSVLGVRTEMALALIVLICFVAGCVGRTVFAKRFVKHIESSILCNIPGYEFFKGVGESILGRDDAMEQSVVLTRFDDSWQLGFLIERLENGLMAVFVPGAPNPHSGSVYFMSPDRVATAQAAPHAALKCLKRLGAGSSELLNQFSQAELAQISKRERTVTHDA